VCMHTQTENIKLKGGGGGNAISTY
jgi:hypothetical protein